MEQNKVCLYIENEYSYPDKSTDFRPDENYPEYLFKNEISSTNSVYRRVREAFKYLGMDKNNFNKPSWNPMGEIVSPGDNVLIKPRANINTVSLFDRPGAARTLLEETEITFTQAVNQQYFAYNYDEETDKLYIMSGSSYYISNNASYLITEIDMANNFVVKQYSMTNKVGSNMRLCYERNNAYCYKGYIYFMNYGYGVKYYIYRQEIGNSANLQKIDKEVRQSQPTFARNGRMYYEEAGTYSGSYCCYIINTDNFTMKEPETYNIYDGNDRQFVPVIGYPLTYYLTCGTGSGTFAIRTDYLATINNLSSPVVKTADKTMKVTYILQEQ